MARTRVIVTALTTLVIVLAAMVLTPSSWVRITPGPSTSLKAPDSLGTFLLTTVEATRISYFQRLVAKAKDQPMLPYSSTPAPPQIDASRTNALTQAKRVSFALSALGSGGGLLTGDLVVSVGLVRIVSTSSFTEAILAARGQRRLLDLGVFRANQRIKVTAHPDQLPSLVAASPTVPDLGTHGVEGSSGGLAFALAYVDALTPGDLTAGRTVAVTGTLATDASVGSIGGVAEKAQAAVRDRSAFMLVPPPNVKPARDAAPGLTLIPVRTLDDAVAYLCSIGGVSSACP